MNAYDALAPIYDAWQDAAGTPFFRLVVPRLEKNLAPLARGKRVFSFADLGCGTGGLLLALREAHPAWRLVGVDASLPMLARAHRGPGAESIMWREGTLELGLPAGCFHDTLNHLPDVASLERTLEAVAVALRPGGLFVFDVTNRRGFERWWGKRNEWKAPGWSLAVETSFDAATGRARGRVTMTQGMQGTEMEVTERCFEERDIRDALDGAGLTVESVEAWSPFDLDDAGKTWWVARAPGGAA